MKVKSSQDEICHEEKPTLETQKDHSTTTNKQTNKASSAGKATDSLGKIKMVIHECTLCSYKTLKKHNLKRHQIVHAEERTYIHCDMCKKVFTTKDGLKKHRKVDHLQ